MAYTKLFSSIVNSTIWLEPDPTRIVWITLLAMADKDGEVQASVPGLARTAGATLEATQAALDKFLAPDPHSRTKTDDGRRIEEIDGGWSLINYAKYRHMASATERQEKAAIRQKRYRDSLKRNARVTGRDESDAGGHGRTHESDASPLQADSDTNADPKTESESAAASSSASAREEVSASMRAAVAAVTPAVSAASTRKPGPSTTVTASAPGGSAPSTRAVAPAGSLPPIVISTRSTCGRAGAPPAGSARSSRRSRW